jgi:hypothetical protein
MTEAEDDGIGNGVHCSQTPDDRSAISRIPISDHVLRSFIPRKGISGLSRHPVPADS